MTLPQSLNNEYFRLFRSRDLVPGVWKSQLREAAEGVSSRSGAPRFRVFNPTLVAIDNGYAMAYRVVDEHSNIRRLATCRLSKALKIVKNTITPLSDVVDFAGKGELNERALTWHADPRYFRLGGKIYMLWNDGANKPENHQFLQEMSEDGLRPVGPAREVVTDLERRSVEKNWMFFENDKGVWAIYAIAPHQVLSVDLSDPDVVMCRKASESPWDSEYNQFYGVLRGSAQPIREGDGFLTIAHSSYKTTKGRVYQACFYRFEAQAPFRVTEASRRPFAVPNPIGAHFDMPRLNQEVHQVVYPCGLVQAEDDLLIAFGINDEVCAIAKVALSEVRRSIAPLGEAAMEPGAAPTAEPPGEDGRPTLPVFWWNAAGKKFDGQFGNRTFKTGNFGDIAAAEVVARLTGAGIRAPGKDKRKIISIGSVLHTARDGDIVWGCGAKGTKMELDPSVKTLQVHACRGPLTLAVLLRAGIDTTRIKHFFDPGCLVPRIYAKEIAAWRASDHYRPGGLRIVPHYRDDLLFRREYPEYSDQFVSVDCTPLEMVEALLGADKVVSSSLHGIIFAEALGIPACWHAPMGGEDELKFYDYYYGTGRFVVKRFETLHDALQAEPMALPVFDFDAYIATFPHKSIMMLADGKPATDHAESDRPESAGHADGAPRPRVDGKPASDPPAAGVPAAVELDGVRHDLEFENFLPALPEGTWAFGKESAIRTCIPDTRPGQRILVKLKLQPFNSDQFKRPQSVRVMLNGTYAATADWSKGEEDELDLRLPLEASGARTQVALSFQARNVRTPWSLAERSHPFAKHQITFCIKDLALVPVKE